ATPGDLGECVREVRWVRDGADEAGQGALGELAGGVGGRGDGARGDRLALGVQPLRGLPESAVRGYGEVLRLDPRQGFLAELPGGDRGEQADQVALLGGRAQLGQRLGGQVRRGVLHVVVAHAAAFPVSFASAPSRWSSIQVRAEVRKNSAMFALPSTVTGKSGRS